jgi:hypothetical protein
MLPFRKLLLPFLCFLLCINTAASLSFELGRNIEHSLVQKGIPFLAVQTWVNLLSYLFFAALALLVRKVRFITVFKISLIAISLILPISVYLLSFSPLSYFLTALFSHPVLSFLGWAYINQITKVSEGKKYYFLLLCLSTAFFMTIAIPLTVVSRLGTSFSSLPLLLGTWLCLGLTWRCNGWIQKRSPDCIPHQQATITFPRLWPTLILFSILFVGFKLILSLNAPLFGSYIEYAATSAPSEYNSFLGKHAFFSGLGILGIFILAPLLGPRLLRIKGWRFCMLLLPIFGLIAITVPQINSSPFSYTFEQTLFKGLDYSWTFPLIQIAFLCFPLQERFLAQTWVFLAIAPLLEWGLRWLQLDPSGILAVSVVILVCMAASIWTLAKFRPAIT